MSSLETRANELAPRCQAALDRGECTRTPCESKEAALRLIREGQADVMTVSEPDFWIEVPLLRHYVIRFNDRELGEAARALSLDGIAHE